MKRPIFYILGILLLTMPHMGYTAQPNAPKCNFFQKLLNRCPVAQKPIRIVPKPNTPIIPKKPVQAIPKQAESEFNKGFIKVRRDKAQQSYELKTVDKTAGNDSLASDLLNIQQNNIVFNPIENATVPTDKPKRKLIKVRR